jgi:hypothetical protein
MNTISAVYNRLRETDFFSKSAHQQSALLSDDKATCLNRDAWLYCLNLPEEVVLTLDHPFAAEIYAASKVSEDAVPWICSKLQGYRNHLDYSFVEAEYLIENVVINRSEYEDFSLFEAMLDVLLKIDLIKYKGYKPHSNRQLQVFELGILTRLSEECPGDECVQREYPEHTAAMQKYKERLRAQIQGREAALEPFSRNELFQMEEIVANSDPVEIELDVYESINKCSFVGYSPVEGGRPKLRFIPLPKPSFDFSSIPRQLVPADFPDISPDRFTEDERAKFLKGCPNPSEVANCGICLHKTGFISCGNECALRMCWNCFHERFAGRPGKWDCLGCHRDYIPIAVRK